MKQYDFMQVVETSKELLNATKDGRITDWVERLAQVAREVGVRLYEINWNQTPQLVAQDVCEYRSEEQSARWSEARYRSLASVATRLRSVPVVAMTDEVTAAEPEQLKASCHRDRLETSH